MSAAFGQNEMWQQHIQMQLQLQQQQEQQAQQTGNRKRVLATEADEFMGIKKRNLGSEAVEHGIYALGGFDHVAGGANGSLAPMATANHHSFSGVGVSPSASATPISAGAFFTPNMTTTVSSDYFGLPPTSQPNQGTAPFFTSRQDSCNSNSAPATPSIGFPGASSNTGVGGGSLTTQMPPAASSALPSSSSSANRFGWPNNGSGGVGGAISNPSTPVTETTAMMLSQNSMSMQQMEEKQILQRNQHYEQMSLYATQQLELEALHLKQEAHAFERALAHQHGASGASYDQPQQQQQQQQQQSYQAHTIEVDRSAHARHSHAVHDNNDPATWGGEASSPMQLRGYLAGQGRGYTPATMGVAALAAAAAMAQSQRSNNQYQQPSQGLVAPTGHQPPQFDEGVGMDMDIANSADLRKVFDASEQEAMMQMIQMMETNTAAISSSLQDTSPPSPPLSFLSLSNTMPPSPTTAALHSFSSSSVYLSSSSLSFPTVFPTLGPEPTPVVSAISHPPPPLPPPSSSSSSSPPMDNSMTVTMMVDTPPPTSLQAQGLGQGPFHHHHHHHHQHHPLAHFSPFPHHLDLLHSPTTPTTAATTDAMTSVSSLHPASPPSPTCTFPTFPFLQQQQQQQPGKQPLNQHYHQNHHQHSQQQDSGQAAMRAPGHQSASSSMLLPSMLLDNNQASSSSLSSSSSSSSSPPLSLSLLPSASAPASISAATASLPPTAGPNSSSSSSSSSPPSSSSSSTTAATSQLQRQHATPLVLSTSQYQFVMGFRADCELCQRRVKGHNAHLVSRPCAGSSSSPMR
ncbi:hypothetical protein DFQ26_009923 [Actinomortierella ambigua]|nr:hypothetical protein DFQ26_009923 [Actinomortierella ambigua]